jgi:hypothetical protein
MEKIKIDEIINWEKKMIEEHKMNLFNMLKDEEKNM